MIDLFLRVLWPLPQSLKDCQNKPSPNVQFTNLLKKGFTIKGVFFPNSRVLFQLGWIWVLQTVKGSSTGAFLFNLMQNIQPGSSKNFWPEASLQTNLVQDNLELCVDSVPIACLGQVLLHLLQTMGSKSF